MEKSLSLILTVTLANLLCFQCTVYNIRRDQRLTLAPITSTTFRQEGLRGHFGRCTMSCKVTSGCCSVNVQWDSATSAMTCELLGKYLHEATSGDLVSAAGWVFIQEDPVSVDPSWAVAFRVTAGSGQSAWDTWNQDGRHDDADQMKSCLHPVTPSSSPCQTNFRSYIMDHWTNIDQVRITLHKNNAVAAEMTFNGQGSTRSSWLAITSVLNSSWTDMTPTTSTEYFAVVGLDFVYRRFYLADFHAGCAGDVGWMVVIDIGQYVSGHCSWDTRHNPGFPVILYSSQSSAVAFDSMTMKADYMLVHVKFLA